MVKDRAATLPTAACRHHHHAHTTELPHHAHITTHLVGYIVVTFIVIGVVAWARWPRHQRTPEHLRSTAAQTH